MEPTDKGAPQIHFARSISARSLMAAILCWLGLWLFTSAQEVQQNRRQPTPIVRAELPTPTGPFTIGTSIFHWTDSSREEPWTEDPNDVRELLVQIWYPAESQAKKLPAPYIPSLKQIESSIDQYWPDRPEVNTHAVLDALLSPTGKPYPVVVFSHGMNSARFRYTAIIEELVSHGYLVVAIDHTYWGPGVAFPYGKTVRYEEGMIARDNLSSDEIDQMMIEGVQVMAADQAFVARKVGELNAQVSKPTQRFSGGFDMSRVGVMGHSMGGMAATIACLEYTAFNSCLSLDGPFYFLNQMPKSSSKPFLLLLNSEWGAKAPEQIHLRYLAAWANPMVAIVRGAKHSSFSDIPLLRPKESKEGLLEPRRAHHIISSTVVAFWDQYLKPESLKSRDEMPQQFSEVEYVNLKAIPKKVN